MTRIHNRTIQKGLNDLDNHGGMVTQLEPDILEYEVKRALGSITTNKLKFPIPKNGNAKKCSNYHTIVLI